LVWAGERARLRRKRRLARLEADILRHETEIWRSMTTFRRVAARVDLGRRGRRQHPLRRDTARRDRNT